MWPMIVLLKEQLNASANAVLQLFYAELFPNITTALFLGLMAWAQWTTAYSLQISSKFQILELRRSNGCWGLFFVAWNPLTKQCCLAQVSMLRYGAGTVQ